MWSHFFIGHLIVVYGNNGHQSDMCYEEIGLLAQNKLSKIHMWTQSREPKVETSIGNNIHLCGGNLWSITLIKVLTIGVAKH